MNRLTFMVALVGFAVVVMSLPAAAGMMYPDPAGGWNYTYNGDQIAVGSDGGSPPANATGIEPWNAWDGTWDHSNNSDAWDGS